MALRTARGDTTRRQELGEVAWREIRGTRAGNMWQREAVYYLTTRSAFLRRLLVRACSTVAEVRKCRSAGDTSVS